MNGPPLLYLLLLSEAESHSQSVAAAAIWSHFTFLRCVYKHFPRVRHSIKRASRRVLFRLFSRLLSLLFDAALGFITS